ncbi:YhgE/Pip family protein [Lacticaseibacillus songhuajiangensis]|uniref:YhgE/Pip family protein n=1 Tax=Lacticaseibacillus songhuajiangensis TaxID=1296539 RepID=UPI000F79012A|nr:YhgE/Pip domain-containing protein [Lacticaseibacillus songhuajiangensis]
MIKKEFANIFKSKSVMLLLVAVIVIPFVYSFCFLTSAWDPYGHTGQVPVAVVNEDEPATLEGKKVNVGEQTIANLKSNDQLGWHFVSKKAAAQGLKDNKYYTVITIPRNFSRNAATVLQPHPKQMKLSYKTNGSLNYISEVMSQVGADKLNSQIRAKVTNAFASTLFAQVGQIGKQIGKAATGATQLSDGIVTLDNGVNKYTVGVSQVHDGLQTLKVAVKPLSSGVQQLTDGGERLKTGLQQLYGNIPALSDGVVQLYSGSQQIVTGLNKVDKKTHTLPENVQKLDDGSNKISAGLGELNSKAPQLATGVNSIYNAVAVGDGSLASGATQLSDGTGQLSTATSQLTDGTSKLSAGTQQLYEAVLQGDANTPSLVSAVNDLATGMAGLQDQIITQNDLVGKVGKLNSEINDNVNNFGTAINFLEVMDLKTAITSGLAKSVLKVDMTLPTDIKWNAVNRVTTKLAAQEDAYKQLAQAVDGLPDDTQTASGTGSTSQQTTTTSNTSGATASTGTTSGTKADATTKAKFKALLTNLKKAMDQTRTTATNSAELNDIVYAQMTTTAKDAAGDPAGLQAAVSLLNTGLTQANTDPTNPSGPKLTFTEALQKLTEGTAELNANVSGGEGVSMSLASAVQQVNDGMTQLNDGATQINDGATQLNTGAVKLNNGVNIGSTKTPSLVSAMTTLNGSVPALQSGVKQLYDGSKQESAGLDELNGQAPQLAGAIIQLLDGSTQLRGGLGQLNSKVPTLASGVTQLRDGSVQLADGLEELNSQTPALGSGVTQLADGADQLNSNSPALTSGTKQLKDGSGQLADGLGDGYKQVNGVKLTNLTAKMFAEPSKAVQKRLTTVPNYGDALAPYVLALALFIAIIIFNFSYPMRRHDGYKSVADWFKAKFAVGTLVALAMAIIEATLMLVVGLHVDHIGQFYGMTILFALAAMYMTQFLNLAFGGVGIFVALGLLTMSGSGGLFPAETISPLYESTQRFLPMTYAINGYRNAISSGISASTVASSVAVLVAIAVISVALMFPAIKYLLTKLESEAKE